ncbi:MAG TPA: RHS repeat domain-containing protein, partial [Pseudomonas sp.]
MSSVFHPLGVLLALASAAAWSPIQAAERSWAYTYNPQGLIETVTGPRTDVTTYAYDAQDRLTSVTNA